MDQLGFVEFADMRWAIKHAYKGAIRLKRAKKRGNGKSPDYLVVDAQGKISFLECKGTQTRRSALVKALGTGREQKQSVTVAGGVPIRHSLAAGIFVPVDGNKESACFHVIDPPREELRDALKRVSPDRLKTSIRQVSLGKQLAAAGMTATGALLLNPSGAAPGALRRAVALDARRSPGTADEEVEERLPARRTEDGFRSERVLRLPGARRGAAEAPVVEVGYATMVPNDVVAALAESQDVERTVTDLAAVRQPSWKRRTGARSREIVSPSGVSFRLSITDAGEMG